MYNENYSIIFSSMTGNTRKLADKIHEILPKSYNTRNQFEGNLTRVRIPPAAPRKNLFCLLRQKRFFVKRGTENAD